MGHSLDWTHTSPPEQLVDPHLPLGHPLDPYLAWGTHWILTSLWGTHWIHTLLGAPTGSSPPFGAPTGSTPPFGAPTGSIPCLGHPLDPHLPLGHPLDPYLDWGTHWIHTLLEHPLHPHLPRSTSWTLTSPVVPDPHLPRRTHWISARPVPHRITPSHAGGACDRLSARDTEAISEAFSGSNGRGWTGGGGSEGGGLVGVTLPDRKMSSCCDEILQQISSRLGQVCVSFSPCPSALFEEDLLREDSTGRIQ